MLFSTSNLFNPVYVILLFSSVIFVSGIIARHEQFFSNLTEPDNSRFRALDGMRGLLAFGVFIHHASIRNICERTGFWLPPQSDLYNFLGSGCVAVFFMITGCLFWSKVLTNPNGIDYPRLWKGRVLRLVPMYLMSYCAILILVAGATHFQTKRTEPLLEVLKEIAIGFTAGLFGPPNINGFCAGTLNAGVVWSPFIKHPKKA